MSRAVQGKPASVHITTAQLHLLEDAEVVHGAPVAQGDQLHNIIEAVVAAALQHQVHRPSPAPKRK